MIEIIEKTVEFHDSDGFAGCFCQENEVYDPRSPTAHTYLYYLAGKQVGTDGVIKPSVEDFAVPTGKILKYSGANIKKSTGSRALTNAIASKWVESFVRPEIHKTEKYFVITQQGIDCLICRIKEGIIPMEILERRIETCHSLGIFLA